MEAAQICDFITRRGKPCSKKAVSVGRCEAHHPEEMERQSKIRADRQNLILTGGGMKRLDIITLIEKLKIIERDLPLRDLQKCISSSEEAGRVFDDLTESSKTIFQQAKRAWHQPQLESLTVLIQNILTEGDTILELGAGKGLLGAIASVVTTTPTVVLDRREGGTGALQASGRIHADLNEIASFSEVLPSGKKNQCLVVAKHFCSNATDLAVQKIAASLDVVSAVLLAPCCHGKMSFDDYVGKEWFESLGFGKSEFCALLQLIELSRDRNTGNHVRSARNITSESLANLKGDFFEPAKLARRLIEEGRIRHIETSMRSQQLSGSLHLMEYVPHCVSPDNLCIIGKVSERCVMPKQISKPCVYCDSGIVLHLSCEFFSDLPRRVAEYLLEQRSKRQLNCEQVWIADPHNRTRPLSQRTGTEVVVINGMNLEDILGTVKSDPLLTRVVDKAFLFTKCVDSFDDVVPLIDTSATHRVYALPKELESEFVSANETTLSFHATKFNNAIHIVEWCLEGEGTRYLFESRPVLEWDPRVWPSLSSSSPGCRFTSRVDEAVRRSVVKQANFNRLSIIREKGSEFDDVDKLKQIIGIGDVPISCVTVTVGGDDVGVEFNGGNDDVNGSLYLVDLPSFVCPDVLLVMKMLSAKDKKGFLLGYAKICPLTRRNNQNFIKNSLASIAADLSGFVSDVEIRHLVSDREHERTFSGWCASPQ